MCERVIDLRVRAGRRFACFLSCRVALSLTLVRFRLACGSGFHSPARFASPVCRRVSFACLGARSLYPPPCSPVPCVSCFVLTFRSCLIRRVRSACRSLLSRSLIGDSMAVPCHPIGAVPCFASSASAFSLLVVPASRPLCSARLVFHSVVSCRPLAPVVALLASPISVSCSLVSVSPLRPSCGLAPFRPSPRLTCRIAGR